jgi:competence protein ComEC
VTVVIDTGHNGETVPLLRSEGVSHIDLLILSHPHTDHAGGFAAILRAFSVADTWYAGDFHGRLQRTLASAGASESVAAGTAKTLGHLSLTVLHPEPNTQEVRGAESDVNNVPLSSKPYTTAIVIFFPGTVNSAAGRRCSIFTARICAPMS